MVNHLNKVRQERAYATSTRFSSCSLSQKNVFIVNQVRKLQNQYLHSSTGDGTLPQAIPGGTRPKVGGAHDKILRGHFIFFVTVGFVYS